MGGSAQMLSREDVDELTGDTGLSESLSLIKKVKKKSGVKMVLVQEAVTESEDSLRGQWQGWEAGLRSLHGGFGVASEL